MDKILDLKGELLILINENNISFAAITILFRLFRNGGNLIMLVKFEFEKMIKKED